MTDLKDPQLHARVRRESEAKRKIAEAERTVLDGARRWFNVQMTSAEFAQVVKRWIELEDAK